MTRFWQQFRSVRGIAAGTSELLALLLGVLELRTYVFLSLAHGSSGIIQATTGAVALVLLAGAIIAMRWGNLVWLLAAWAFVLGAEFSSALQLADNVAGSLRQLNALTAAIAVNFEVPITVIGFSIAVMVALMRPSKRPISSK